MNIYETREQIAALKIEQAAIITQPVSRADVEQDVRAGVRGCEPLSESAVSQTLQRWPPVNLPHC